MWLEAPLELGLDSVYAPAPAAVVEPLISAEPILLADGIYIEGKKVAYFVDPDKHLRFTRGNTKFQAVIEEFLARIPAGQEILAEQAAKTDHSGSVKLTKPVGPAIIPQTIPDRPRGAPHLGSKDPAVIAWDARYGNK